MIVFIAIGLAFGLGWLLGSGAMILLVAISSGAIKDLGDQWARTVDQLGEPTPEARRSQSL